MKQKVVFISIEQISWVADVKSTTRLLIRQNQQQIKQPVRMLFTVEVWLCVASIRQIVN